jgi:hypothetical protein
VVVRPADWWVLDLVGDPTPGDPFAVRDLARRFLGLAADADHAAGRVRSLAGTEAVSRWVGESGDAYRDEIGDFPGQLAKLSASYGLAGQAVTAYAVSLDGAQVQADRALVAGREARARWGAAKVGLSAAEAAESSAALAADGATRPPARSVPPAGSVSGFGSAATVLVPDPAVVAAAVRNHTAAQTRLVQARATEQAARDDLDAARRLALAAQGLREQAEDTAAHALNAASHAGIRNKGFWGHLKDAATTAWHLTVAVCKVAVVVLAVVALIVGGPLVWGLLLAASLVVLADTLDRYRQGKASLLDVGLAALACIPGGRLAGEGADLVRLTAAGRTLTTRGRTLLTAGRVIVRGFPEAARGSIRIVKAVTPEGREIVAGISADASPLRNLISKSVGDAKAAGGGSTAESLASRAAKIRAQGGVRGSRNIASADASIDGQAWSLDAVSGAASRKGLVDSIPAENRIFHPSADPNLWRPTDSEYKILEAIGARISPGATGQVVIYTERPPCDACLSVVEQFEARFPGVHVVVHHGGAV